MKLDAARAMQTLHFCSRSGPPPFDDTWQPSAADVANLEASFEALEDNTRSGCIRDDWSVSDYYRWYVGLIGADGRRLIYVNAVLASVVGESEKDAGSWSDEFVDLCDGGLAAWGAVYDVEKHAFTVVEQNGSIE